ncbi:alanine--tRNA ligase [Ahrensia marina]|uniref:Alanine--tRNA ligase n=1 Tax=Ahrensia marina TaxID=1514904 RepID=A0A0M9GN52_9HYPH|nr:alanine--tRNA ligase [Ahrensia marina]KPB01693.1 alanyl-tRNA synthetase [Ahrensia marina]
MSGVNEIRNTFLDYFGANGHAKVPSSSLVPHNDPTLMFTAAGMVQFKNVFTGLEKRDYTRATTSQKCVRAGGKHNDLDNVGYTARHHTFFEMLGNFSFGDYFKEEAITHAWNLVTKEYGLDKDRLLVTIYHTDDQAFDLWKKIAGLPDEKIIRIATSDNFWSAGDTGPCGPCSEIFYDHGDHIWGGPPGSPEEDGDRFVEIWNLVFMQYEQIAPDVRHDLPSPSIDTGMGLERISAVMQGVHDNYDIDLFKALIRASEELTSTKAEGANKASHRVIADHLRATSFLIADGVLPSNEGRGYVLRRIMRRAMRHAHLLGAQDPLMHRLVPSLITQMGAAYPELDRARGLITETLELEETKFRKTLDRGLGLLNDAAAGLKEGDSLSGETAFKLYDTYGFPLDLTQDALRARNIEVDLVGFDTAMEKQKAEARANWSGSGDAADEKVWFALRDEYGATEFFGYETEKAEGVINAIVKDGEITDSAGEGDKVSVTVNQTPFYGESGGQQGDRGVIKGDGFELKVLDTLKKANGLFVHVCEVASGKVEKGAPVELIVDHLRRSKLRSNHSATHLIHEALREVLGTHVVQKGSLVAEDRLRFDFSHNKPISDEDLAKISDIANEIVLQNSPVTTRLMNVDDAREAGAMALFGEKYGDEVRVVSMGTALRGEKQGQPYSLELCGGTHVAATGEIGVAQIIGESAVSSGVRRIEALTGEAARHYLQNQDALMRRTAGLLKTSPEDVVTRIEGLLDERKKMERELTEARKALALAGPASGGGEDGAREINGVKFLGRVVSGVSPRDLKPMVDEAKASIGSGVVVLIAVSDDGKASIVVGVTGDLVAEKSAVDLVRVGSAALGGKGGGGRPDMAQAGGPDGAKADAAIEAIAAAL